MSRPLGAQRPVVIDVGVTGVQFPDEDAFALGPSIRAALSGTRGRLSGTASGGTIATPGGASGFLSLDGAARSTSARGWSTELASELGVVAGTGSSGTAGTALLGGRVIWSAGAGGAWLRGSGHQGAREFGSVNGAGVDGGAWWTWSRAQLVATVAHERTTGGLFTGQFHSGFVGTTPVRYTDATLALHVEDDRVSLDLSAVARRDPDATRVVEGGYSATLALWSGESHAFTLSASRQLPDWVHGADAADAVSVGMRFLQATPAADRALRLVPFVQVVDAADDARLLRVRASGARRVEVMGDFTGWEPVVLTRSGDAFEGTVKLGTGSHRLVVRIDGGAWRPAANTPAVDDDLGGRAGLLVVP